MSSVYYVKAIIQPTTRTIQFIGIQYKYSTLHPKIQTVPQTIPVQPNIMYSQVVNRWQQIEQPGINMAQIHNTNSLSNDMSELNAMINNNVKFIKNC